MEMLSRGISCCGKKKPSKAFSAFGGFLYFAAENQIRGERAVRNFRYYTDFSKEKSGREEI